jgi:hypothetical protein
MPLPGIGCGEDCDLPSLAEAVATRNTTLTLLQSYAGAGAPGLSKRKVNPPLLISFGQARIAMALALAVAAFVPARYGQRNVNVSNWLTSKVDAGAHPSTSK